MTHRTHTFATAAALALGLTFLSAPVSADESIATRAASALGHYIAMQGNAALDQIRDEFKRDLAQRMKPYLPDPASVEKAETAPQASALTQ